MIIVLKQLKRLPVAFLLLLIWLYRNTLSLLLAPSCRYEPTCSQYAVDALNKYGLMRGTIKAARRIGRCHPYSRHSGYDPA